MFHGIGPRLLAEVSSDAVTCPSVPDLLAEVSSDAAMCPMASGSTFLRGKLWCYHMSHGPRRDMDHRNKERLSCSRHTARLTCFHGALVHYRSACSTCMLLQCRSIVQHRPNFHGHGYKGDTTRQDGTTVRVMFSAAER
jgi:hypothetical protein